MQWQTVEVPGSARSVQLANLLPFALYSVDVAAVRAGGVGEAAHVNAWTAKPAGMSRYLYLVNLPKDATGFPEMWPDHDGLQTALDGGGQAADDDRSHGAATVPVPPGVPVGLTCHSAAGAGRASQTRTNGATTAVRIGCRTVASLS